MAVQAKRPEGVTIVVVNRKTKKSKSFTVYGELEEVFKKVKRIFK